MSTLPLTVVKQLMSSSSVIALLPIVQRWGLKTLGEFAALPTEELFSRLGPDGLELQRVARGEDSHPFVPETAEKRFEQTITLEWPVDGLEPLSFVLGRVLEPLCAQLDSCGVSVGALRVRLTLVSRDTHERTLRFPAPVSDAKVLRTLVLLDLESHPPSAGIDQVTVVADPVPTRTLQFSLLERAMPSPEQLSTLLARLTVLMGDQRCGSPGLVDTYWPGAFEMQSFTPKARPPIVLRQAQRDLSHGLQAVLRRFRVPVIARVTIERGQPVRVSSGLLHSESGRVVTCAGPWRSSGSWWTPSSLHASSFSASSWDHDEWDVALRDGGLYRIFQDRTTKRWFIEGSWTDVYRAPHVLGLFLSRRRILPETLVDQAAALDYPALALLDRDGVYGAPRFHKAAVAAGIKPIIGTEFTIRANGDSKRTHAQARIPVLWRLPVLIETQEGYRNLSRLVTRMKAERRQGRRGACTRGI